MTAVELLETGDAALQAGRWADALAAFERALGEEETAGALAGVGEALWWLGEPRRSITYHERAYTAFRRAGEAARAAWTAMWLCLAYKADLGNQAAASGWIARAERVLQDADPDPMRGWLCWTRAFETTDVELAQELLERALELARASGDVDLELCALADLGEALVVMGRVEKGFALIDEAMAGTLGGEYTRLDTVVFTCCSMLNACELAADLARATQWCRVADDFIQRYGCPYLYAECRTTYGGILVATGRWDDAERELTTAVGMTRDAWPAMHALALARLADLRLRQGRLEEAEGLLEGVEDDLAATLPTAALRLAQGEPAVSVALLQRRLHLLGEKHMEAARMLELLVDASLAQGDLDGAAAAAERLGELALGRDRDHVAARAARAVARVSLARGEPDAAVPQLETAVERLSRLDLPFEAARARLDLARALANREPAVAVAEARSAFAAFDRLGAAADADAAAAFLRTLGAAGRSGPKQVGILTKREQEVLHLVGFGLSNPEIAGRLVISRKTAAHHVSSVLAKLGLRNRAEAVAYATRNLG